MSKRPAPPERLMRGAVDDLAVQEGCYYDKAKADHAVKFFNTFLCHSKGEWANQLFQLLEWQEWEVVRPLFGWMRPDGTRRFRRAYIEVPKKNGKSTICSGIALYLLVADKEPGAEVYSAAADKEQAAIVYQEAANMVEASDSLSQRLITTDSKKRISHPGSKSFFRALSSDVPTKEGFNIHGLIFDELHAQKDRKLWGSLKYGGASRRQPLFVSITTAGTDTTTICYDQHKYARGVLNGRVLDISFYALIYSLPDDADWADPKNWKKANPSYGVTLREDQFRADFEEAKANVGSENDFRRYRLNQWTKQEKRWLPMNTWRKCPSTPPDISNRLLPFFGGLDLASVNDVAAYIQLFYKPEFYVKCHFFIPEERMSARIMKDHVPYDVWVKQGWLTATRGNVIDEDLIVQTILKSGDMNRCIEVGYDPWNAPHIVTSLVDEGVKMVPVRQGFPSLNYPSKELAKLIDSLRFNHGGNPMLTWMAENVAVETDAAANIKPSKKKSFEKIDGIVATVIALSRYLIHNQIKPSKYESQGLTSLEGSDR